MGQLDKNINNLAAKRVLSLLPILHLKLSFQAFNFSPSLDNLYNFVNDFIINMFSSSKYT